jgi:hypothetical protein
VASLWRNHGVARGRVRGMVNSRFGELSRRTALRGQLSLALVGRESGVQLLASGRDSKRRVSVQEGPGRERKD